MYYLEDISKYQFKQTKILDIELLIVKNKMFDKETEQKLLIFKEKYKKDYGLNLYIKFVKNIPVSPSGKFLFIISQL